MVLAFWMGDRARVRDSRFGRRSSRRLVAREDLPNAIGLNSILFNLARLAGSGDRRDRDRRIRRGLVLPRERALVPCGHRGAAGDPGGRTRVRPPAAIRRSWARCGKDLRYVRSQPLLVGSARRGLATASLAGMPYTVLLPSFAERVLHAGPETYGFLTSAVGIGAIASALVPWRLRKDPIGLERWVVVCGVLFGVSLIVFSRSSSIGVSIAALIPVGASFMFMMAGVNTLLQLAVPDELRGRVMSLHSSLFLGVLPLGGLLAGIVRRPRRRSSWC